MVLVERLSQVRWSLRTKILASFGAVVIAMIVVGVFGISQHHRMQDRVSAIAARDIVPMTDLQGAAGAHYQGVIIGALMENAKAPDALASLQQTLDTSLAQADASLKHLLASAPDTLRPTVERLIADRTAFTTAHRNRIIAAHPGRSSPGWTP
jgi:hypothetical protein